MMVRFNFLRGYPVLQQKAESDLPSLFIVRRQMPVGKYYDPEYYS